jgi:RNA polymerase sigma-70 factor (family 1)
VNKWRWGNTHLLSSTLLIRISNSTVLIAQLSNHYTDEYLFQLVKEGEKTAFDALFNRYQKRTYQVAYNRLRNREIAEEIVQDVFVTLWLKRETTTIEKTFASYLFTSVKYSILNYLRHQAVRDKYLNAIEKRLTAIDNTTQEFLSGKELENNVEQAIQELSEKCQKVYRMRFQQYYSVSEISQQLSVSPNTVKNHLIKAQKYLRDQLKEFLALALLTLQIF